MDDTFKMDLFSCNQGKPHLQIKPHLVAKTTNGSRACPVIFLNPFIQNVLKKLQILLHGRKLMENGLGD